MNFGIVRLVKCILLISFLCFFRYTILPNTVATIAKRIFEHGTGSCLTYSKVKIHFFPLKAIVYDLVLYDPKIEGFDGGVRIGEYSIVLDFSYISRRVLFLKEMKLKRIFINSLGKDTSFFRLLDFLFPSPSQQKLADLPFWKRYLDSWEVNGGKIEIGFGEKDTSSINMEVGNVRLLWKNVSVLFERRSPCDESVFNIIGIASDFYIGEASNDKYKLDTSISNLIKLGNLNVHGTLIRKLFKFETIDIENSSVSEGKLLKASGTMSSGRDGVYDLVTTLNIPASLILNKFVSATQVNNSDLWRSIAKLNIYGQGHISGILDLPIFKFDGHVNGADPSTNLLFFDKPFEKGFSLFLDLDLLYVDFKWHLLEDLSNIPQSGVFQLGLNKNLPIMLSLTSGNSAPLLLKASRNLLDKSFTISKLEIRDIDPLLIRSYIHTLTNLESLAEISPSSKLNISANDLIFRMGSIPQGGLIIADISDIRSFGREIDAVSLEVEFFPDRASLAKMKIKHHKGQLLLSGGYVYNANLNLDIKGEAIEASNVFLSPLPGIYNLVFDFDGSIKGRVEDLRLTATTNFFSTDLQKGRQKIFGSQCRGGLKVISCKLKTDDNSLMSDISIHPSNGTINLDIDSVNLPINLLWKKINKLKQHEVSSIAVEQKDVKIDTKLNSISARLTYHGNLYNLKEGYANLSISKLSIDQSLIRAIFNNTEIENTSNLYASKIAIKNDGAIHVIYSNGSISFNEVSLITSNFTQNEKTQKNDPILKIKITGGLDINNSWNLRIRGTSIIDNTLLSIPPFDNYRIAVDGDLSIIGKIFEPNINGSIEFDSGEFSIRKIADLSFKKSIALSSLAFNVQFDNYGAEIKDLSAQLGSGSLGGNAKITHLFNDKIRNISANLKFDDVALEPIENGNAQLNGKLNYRANELLKERNIEGHINITKAEYRDSLFVHRILKLLLLTLKNPTALTDTLERTVSSRITKIENEINSKSSDTKLNVEIVSSGPVNIDTPLLQADLFSKLQILGTVTQPKLDGSIDFMSGSFGFQSKQFSVLDGCISFDPNGSPLNPQIDVLSEARVKRPSSEQDVIQLLLRGNLSNPHIALSSSSGLTSREIIALLGIGGGNESLTILRGDGQRRSVYELLDPNSSVSTENRLSGITGFTEVTVDRSTSTPGGKLQPRIIARRPFIGESELVVDSSLSNSKENKARAEYPIGSNFGIIAEWQQKSARNPSANKGNFGAGFEYRKDCSSTSLMWCD